MRTYKTYATPSSYNIFQHTVETINTKINSIDIIFSSAGRANSIVSQKLSEFVH